MDDKPDVRFIDAHAEGDGGTDDIDVATGEGLLVLLADDIRETGVVGKCRKSLILKLSCEIFRRLLGETVYDAGIALMIMEILHQLREVTGLWHHAVGEVLPVETPDKPGWLSQGELLCDVILDGRYGGRGQGDDRDVREPFFERPEPAILGPEVVPPHRYAVRFIDGYESEIRPFDKREERGLHGTLRGDVEDSDAAFKDHPLDYRSLPVPE